MAERAAHLCGYNLDFLYRIQVATNKAKQCAATICPEIKATLDSTVSCMLALYFPDISRTGVHCASASAVAWVDRLRESACAENPMGKGTARLDVQSDG